MLQTAIIIDQARRDWVVPLVLNMERVSENGASDFLLFILELLGHATIFYTATVLSSMLFLERVAK